MVVEQILAGIAILLLIAVFASKASGRLGVPVLILFLGLGVLAGAEGLGGIDFDDVVLAQRLGIVALIFILFAGGMETDWNFVRPIVPRAVSLATVGIVVTSLVVGWFAYKIAGLSFLDGMLLGAIVSSTDAAAVFAILRSRGVRLRREITATLELESGSNDPTAVFLTTAILQMMQTPAQPLLHAILDFVRQMTFGAATGILFGWIAIRMLNRSKLEYQGLYPVMTIAIVLFTYAFTSLIGGSGFLAVYVLGIAMTRTNFVQRRTLTKFHDGLAWLMQIAMFITLGLLVFPSQLLAVAGVSLLMAVVLMFLARPLAVFISTAAARMTFKEKLLVSWVGLRGAVPIILATFALVAGIPAAGLIFNIVFFIVFSSVILQGTTIATVARWLGLDTAQSEDYSPAVAHLAGRGDSALITVEVPKGSPTCGKRVVELGWPREALILVMYRGNEFFVPNGATTLGADDRLIVLTSKTSADAIRSTIEPST